MPYNQLPPEIAYPPITSTAWVVISRLSETPVRTVPNLGMVNHASEFALPFPTGRFPSKVTKLEIERQMVDDLKRPLYDDGASGTASDVDGSGNPWPPKLETVEEEVRISLLDNPTLFDFTEVKQAVQRDFLEAYPFYDRATIILFDDRSEGEVRYQNKQVVSGLASGAHPIFIGPYLANFDRAQDPRGHVMLIAPEAIGFNYYLQIRHGSAGSGIYTGPIEDIGIASRQGEIFHLYPMENLPLTGTMLADPSTYENNHFWIRSANNGSFLQPERLPVIPWMILMTRSSGKSTKL